jgi:hypothetical protein
MAQSKLLLFLRKRDSSGFVVQYFNRIVSSAVYSGVTNRHKTLLAQPLKIKGKT